MQIDGLLEDAKSDITARVTNHFESNPDVPELGDYLPFMNYFGETEWASEHVNGALVDLEEPVPPRYREDTLLGLLEYYRMTGDAETMNGVERYLSQMFQLFVRDDQILTPYFQRDRGIQFPNLFIKYLDIGIRLLTPSWNIPPYQAVPRNGMYIELLVDTYEATGKSLYLERSMRLANKWIEGHGFESHQVFTSPPPLPFIYRSNLYAQLFKDNTAIVNGLLSVYAASGDERYLAAFERWLEGVRDKFIADGYVYGIYWLRSGSRERRELRFTFPLVDILCYATSVTGDVSYVNFAEGLIDPWIPQQGDVGLFPNEPGGQASHIDVSTDFSVSLLRLAELLDDKQYQKMAEESIQGLLTHHRFPLYVDIDSGSVLDPRVAEKFVALMSKAIIAYNSETIYDYRSIFKLLRDR